MVGFFRRRRRKRLLQQAPPAHWEAILTARMPRYARLPETLRPRLLGAIQIFLAEKHFEGCGGLALTETMRVTVAAHACLLLLGRSLDFYPGLRTILLYPTAFYVNREEENALGLVEEVDDYQEGESWDSGAVVLSWRDILHDTRKLDGRNVLLHEFAHQLDDQGFIAPAEVSAHAAWEQTLQQHYEAHQTQLARGLPTFLDPYGAEAPHEFFAVATEAFFELPVRFRKQLPELYEALRMTWGVNPATW